MTTARRVFYEGRVQGVGFRFMVKEIAQGYEVSGIVKNLVDGRVELLTQGDEAEVEGFLAAILQSQLRAHIHRHASNETAVDPDLRGFKIQH